VFQESKKNNGVVVVQGDAIKASIVPPDEIDDVVSVEIELVEEDEYLTLGPDEVMELHMILTQIVNNHLKGGEANMNDANVNTPANEEREIGEAQDQLEDQGADTNRVDTGAEVEVLGEENDEEDLDDEDER